MMVQFCDEIFENICDFLLCLKMLAKLRRKRLGKVRDMDAKKYTLSRLSVNLAEAMPQSHPRHRAQEGQCLGLDRAKDPVNGIMPSRARALPRTCPRPRLNQGRNLGSNRAKNPAIGMLPSEPRDCLGNVRNTRQSRASV